MWDHIVRPGESLWQISKRFNKNLNEIFHLNPQIRDKNNIWPGMVVHMPDPAPQGDVIVGPITVINDTYNGSEEPIELAPQFRPPEDNLFYRPMPNPHRGGRFQPIFDDDTKAVIGYMYASLGYYEVYDLSGQRIWSDEEPAETPLLDPIDFIFIVEGLARGIGKAALKLGIRAAASAGSKAIIREVTTAIIGTMRGAFRAVISARTLKFTATTVERMATRGRYVPMHLLKMAIRFGARDADPQGVKGAFQYTLKIIRSEPNIAPGLNPAASWAGRTYTLKVVVKEELTSNTVLHFHYQ